MARSRLLLAFMWMGIAVAAAAGPSDDHILDEFSYEQCAMPDDDVYIMRLTNTLGYVDYQDPQNPDGYTFSSYFRSRSLPDPIADEINNATFDYRYPWETKLVLGFATQSDNATAILQGSYEYAHGDSPSHPFYTYDKSMTHTLSSEPSESNVNSHLIITFVAWDLCISHIRPDRLAMTFTVDARAASNYNEALPYPVMLVMDQTDTKGGRSDPDTDDYAWWPADAGLFYLVGQHFLFNEYHNTSEEEVWSHLESND
jgi:hypothetical protein